MWCHLPGLPSQEVTKAQHVPVVWLDPRSAVTPHWAASGPEFSSFPEQQEIWKAASELGLWGYRCPALQGTQAQGHTSQSQTAAVMSTTHRVPPQLNGPGGKLLPIATCTCLPSC